MDTSYHHRFLRMDCTRREASPGCMDPYRARSSDLHGDMQVSLRKQGLRTDSAEGGPGEAFPYAGLPCSWQEFRGSVAGSQGCHMIAGTSRAWRKNDCVEECFVGDSREGLTGSEIVQSLAGYHDLPKEQQVQ